MRSSQNFLAIDSVAFGDAAGEVFNEIVDRSIVLEHPGTFHPFEVRGALGFFQHIIEDEKGQAEQSVFFPDAEKDDAVSPAGKIPGPEKMPRGQKPYAAVEALQERGVIGKGDHASGGLIAAYAASRSDLCCGLVLEDPPFFSCQGERRKQSFNYVDLSTVCHEYLHQTEETDFVLYYFAHQRLWDFFPETAREKLRPRLIASAAKYRRKHPERDLRVPFWPRTGLAAYQGMNRYDDITTLGRGGSDTSAVALAAELKADLCQIYTDVDGVYTADPRIVKSAKKLEEISFDEMLELASCGAQVLHNRSVEMAKKYNVNLEVLSSLENKPGTKVKEVTKMEKMLIKGVAKDDDVARISVVGLPDKPGIAFRIFSVLASKKVNVDIILQSVGRDGTKDISFTVPEESLDAAIEALNDQMELLGAHRIEVDEDVTKVSIVGAGMQSNPGVAAKMFEALYEADINIQMISTSEIKISVLIQKGQGVKAMNAVSEAFIK